MPKTPRHLPLKPVDLYVLLTLARAPQHGYVILQRIDELSSGRVRPGPATLYDGLHRLEGKGLLEEASDLPSDGRGKRSYRLTSLGQKVLKAEAERLADIVELAYADRILPAPEGRR